MARETMVGVGARARARVPAAQQPAGGAYKWMALSCTSLGTLLATLNSGTLIIALPVLLRELHTDLITLVWVLLSYRRMRLSARPSGLEVEIKAGWPARAMTLDVGTRVL